MKRWGAVALLVVLTTSGVACRSDGPSSVPTPSTTSSTIASSSAEPLSAKGTATLGGGVEGSGDYEVQYSVDVTSCESRVASTTYVIPLPGRLGSTRFQWQAALARLQGPGEYGLVDMTGLQATVIVDGIEAKTVYAADSRTTATLQLDAHGSGSFTFAGLHGPSGDELHGTATWTCGPRG